MSEETRSVSLRGWQWSLVVVLAVLAGMIGGLVGGFVSGGVKVYVSDDSPRFYGSLDLGAEDEAESE